MTLLAEFQKTTQSFDEPCIGIAVSGGGDSMALLHLACATFPTHKIHVVTVDHKLRDAAADEARMVGQECQNLSVSHDVLVWKEWDGQGNLQDQARRGRYGLIAEWAKTYGIETVMLGHTLNDQAETFLMRLARGSGVDGLSGMAPIRSDNGINWWRPLLGNTRQDLRDYLIANGKRWVDDPTNDDEHYDRVKARKMLKVLAPLGIDARKLAKTADELRPARNALELQTQDAARTCAQIVDGNVHISRTCFLDLPSDISARLLSHSLNWVSGAHYRPRRNSLERVIEQIEINKASVLHGCKIVVRNDDLIVMREFQAIKKLVSPINEIWDGRWFCQCENARDRRGLTIRALGVDGLAQCDTWRETDKPRMELLVSPSIWRDETLICAPMAGFFSGWRIKMKNNMDHFVSTILSH